MLAVFALRLAAGMIGCLLLLPVRVINPRFFRTHFLTALALAGISLACVRDTAEGPLLAWIGASLVLAFAGSLVWGLEGAPGGRAFIVLTMLALAGSLARVSGWSSGSRFGLVGDATSAALLGSAVTAMLLGHSYLIAPTMSLKPLMRLLAALAVAILARLAVDGYALERWASMHSYTALSGDTALWLALRWLVGFLAPLGLDWMAWQTARIRSTQSATGILYVVVIFCVFAETLSLGRGFEPHSCLDFILQELHRFPGRGAKLIEAGLKSPVVRNRNKAVAALAAWSRAEWPGGLGEALEQAAECEPNEDVRERMRQALRGEPLSP